MFARFMNLFLREKINPLIGAAGVSAVPDSARVVQMVGQQEDPQNFLLMHAMAPNVSGVIGSAVAAGVLWAVLGTLAPEPPAESPATISVSADADSPADEKSPGDEASQQENNSAETSGAEKTERAVKLSGQHSQTTDDQTEQETSL